jgi:DNA-binding GntR family transcriptional regulator
MAAALSGRDLLAWAAADERFHRALLDLSGNRRLTALAATMWDQVHRARLATVRLRPLPARSNTEHRALLAALRRGDEQRAHDLHRRHRRRTARMLTSLLRRHAVGEV